MKKISKMASIILLSILCISSTKKLVAQSGEVPFVEVEKFSFGMCYGECLDYCIFNYSAAKSPAFDRYFITRIASSWDGSLLESEVESIALPEWNNLRRIAHYNEFLPLDGMTFGCPDCADGGATWIEILGSNGDKIFFTYDRLEDIENSPVTSDFFIQHYLKPLLEEMKAIQSRFQK